MSIELIRMSKPKVTRLFVAAVVAVGAGLVLAIAALWVALASDAIDVGGDSVVDVNGGSGAWIALGLVIVGSLAILAGTIAAVLSWLGAFSTHGSSKTRSGSRRCLRSGCSASASSRRSLTSSRAPTARRRAWHLRGSRELPAHEGRATSALSWRRSGRYTRHPHG
jgi:hypothetical protein